MQITVSKRRGCHSLAVTALFVWLIGASGSQAQEGQALPVHLSFAFQSDLVNPRFVTIGRAEVEKQIETRLAVAGAKSLYPFEFDTNPGKPALKIWTAVRNGNWFLEITLDHEWGRPTIQDHWESPLLRAEDIVARGGLPIDTNWSQLVDTAFKKVINRTSSSGMELFQALEEFAPLGKTVASVSSPKFLLPGAVLPLRWDKYEGLSTSRFRIYYVNANGVLVTLHSDGTGRSLDFPSTPSTYQGLLVLHKKWQMGASDDDLEPIGSHIADLSGLSPIEFHLEEFYSIPVNLSVAK